MTKAGVSISCSRMPGVAGGGCSIGSFSWTGGSFGVSGDAGNRGEYVVKG
jgi:hypothetical protein